QLGPVFVQEAIQGLTVALLELVQQATRLGRVGLHLGHGSSPNYLQLPTACDRRATFFLKKFFTAGRLSGPAKCAGEPDAGHVSACGSTDEPPRPRLSRSHPSKRGARSNPATNFAQSAKKVQPADKTLNSGGVPLL